MTPFPDATFQAPARRRRRLMLSPALWLVSVFEDPEERHRQLVRWGDEPGGLLLLPCGRLFDALRMPEELGLSVVEVLLEGTDVAGLGPVLHDQRSGLVYALIAPRCDVDWVVRHPDLRLLSTGSHLAVPSPELGWLTLSVVWTHMPACPEPSDPAALAAALDAVAGRRRGAA
ncbi:hypothetical protein ABTY61_32280 [Kitasatospora sp. NPDC096128]|uniref:hypothetical protein n=1 Tax=Kitasatospora sp. NPDC096128 TaxID=3155547 RepID=UPI0033228BD1